MSKSRRATKRAHMGDRLESLLREQGRTQADLARQLRVSRQAVCKLFGRDKWDADTILGLAEVLGVPTDYFFGRIFTLPHRVISR